MSGLSLMHFILGFCLSMFEINCLLFSPGNVEMLTQHLSLLMSTPALCSRLSRVCGELVAQKFSLSRIDNVFTIIYSSLTK